MCLNFGIGFPPRVGRLFMLGETEFTINLLPLGGLCAAAGRGHDWGPRATTRSSAIV